MKGRRRTGGGSSRIIVQQHPSVMLAGYLRDWWHDDLSVSLVSGEVDSWTGQKLGLVLSAAAAGNRPTYGADGGYFRGRNVVQCAASGSKYLRCADFGSDIFAAGSLPWSCLISRNRSATAGDYTWSLTSAGGNAVSWGMFYGGSAEANSFMRTGTGENCSASGDVKSPDVEMIEVWGRSAGGVSLRTNMGTTYNAGAQIGLHSDFSNRRVSIGGRVDGAFPGNTSIRALYLCVSKPPDSVIAGILQYYRNDSGF